MANNMTKQMLDEMFQKATTSIQESFPGRLPRGWDQGEVDGKSEDYLGVRELFYVPNAKLSTDDGYSWKIQFRFISGSIVMSHVDDDGRLLSNYMRVRRDSPMRCFDDEGYALWSTSEGEEKETG